MLRLTRAGRAPFFVRSNGSFSRLTAGFEAHPGSRRGTVVAGMACLALLATACSADAEPGLQPAPPASSSTPDEDVIGPDGLDVSVGSTLVSFPAGAATGATVDAEQLLVTAAPTRLDTAAETVDLDTTTDAADPDDVDQDAATDGEADGETGAVTGEEALPGLDEAGGVPFTALGEGVDVSLDDGQTQPALPVTVVFDVGALEPDPDLPDSDVPATAPEEDAGAANVALVVVDADGTSELVPATYDPTAGTVSGEVPHFSSIWPIRIDFDAMLDTVLQSIGVAAAEPPCNDQPATVGEETYSVVSDPLMWLCVKPTDDGAGLRVEATVNAGTPFLAAPAVPAQEVTAGSAAKVASAGTVAVSQAMGLVPEGQVAVFPGGVSTLTYPEAPGEFDIAFEPAPEMFLVAILAEVAGVAWNMRGGEFVERVGKLECLADVGALLGKSAGAGLSGAGLTPEVAAQVTSSFYACVGSVADLSKAQEVVVGILTAAPQLLIGGLWGAVTTAAGASSFTATVRASSLPGSVVSAEDLAPFVGLWHGPVNQDGSMAYRVEVTLSIDAAGQLVGRVRYPELDDCTGYWDAPILSGRTLRMTEHIETSQHHCVDEVPIVLRRVGEQLRYVAEATPQATRARAVLTRGPLPNAPAPGTRGSGGWPTGKNDAPPALMAWLGANMYDFPEWVACDDVQSWCVVGGTAEHRVVRMDDLVDVGSVPDSVPDPSAALTRLGVPAAIVPQILT